MNRLHNFTTHFLSTLAALLIGFIQVAISHAKETSKRPNIVFIFSDDLTRQAISCYQDPRHLLQTPNMDRIAAQGMRFDNCYVTNSICGPSRATVLTGLYSHRNGFFNNSNSVFDSSQQTFPKLLQHAGYETAMIGKWHLGSNPTGFDEWCILPGQGAYYNPDFIDNGKRVKIDGYVTDIITEKSLQWLKDRDQEKPFLLMMQHKAPHRQWEPAARHLNWNQDHSFAEPATLFDEYTNRSKAVVDQDMEIATTMTKGDLKLVPPKRLNSQQLDAWNQYYAPRNEQFEQANLSGEALVRWKYQRYIHDYLACVAAVDESVGQLLDYLDEAGLSDNTLVVCTSDQGFYLGEHGWFDKRWIFEESASTPLMVQWPGKIKAGSTCNEIVSLMDFAPTFLEIAQAEESMDIQGRSMVPLLESQPVTDWRDSLYYHYYEYPQPHHVRPHYGLITDRYKLVHYYGIDVDDWELLDRRANPEETIDYYDDPPYAMVRQELTDRLAKKREEAGDTEPAPREAYGN